MTMSMRWQEFWEQILKFSTLFINSCIEISGLPLGAGYFLFRKVSFNPM